MNLRHRVLAAVLVATIGGSIWALVDDSAEPLEVAPVARAAAKAAAVAPTSFTSPRPGAAAADADVALVVSERFGLAVARRDLFAGGPAAPASAVAAPPAVAAPASAPVAPPPALTLPFAYAGRLVTADGPSVLLNEGNQTRVLALGGSLGEFRLEQDHGLQLEFVHVPSGERLTLALQP